MENRLRNLNGQSSRIGIRELARFIAEEGYRHFSGAARIAAELVDQSVHRVAAKAATLRALDLQVIEPADQITECEGAIAGHGA